MFKDKFAQEYKHNLCFIYKIKIKINKTDNARKKFSEI